VCTNAESEQEVGMTAGGDMDINADCKKKIFLQFDKNMNKYENKERHTHAPNNLMSKPNNQRI
jgi:uncharacterized protein YecT (DUF1311 family)